MRVIIVGGPRCGKSTHARKLRAEGLPTLCGDPRSKVKDPEDAVEYLPEHLPISGDDGAAQWIVSNWLSKPGPWCVEGWCLARALRRWPHEHMPADRIVVFTEHHPEAEIKRGQTAMLKAVLSVWQEIAWRFEGITEYR